MSQQSIMNRKSQELSKNILQNIQKENKNPVKSFSPFQHKTNISRQGSPEKGKCNSSFGTLTNSKIELGNTNIYNKNTNTKCSINKLGLQLRPYCTNKDHRRSNITHICIADECQTEDQQYSQRLSCQFCIFELHSNHKEACIPIEQFSEHIDSHFQNVTESFKDLNFQCLKMQNPPFLQKVYDSLNVLKLAVCQHIDNQKLQFKQQICKKAEEYIPKYEERIDSYQMLQNKYKTVSQKNVFELDEQQIDILLKFSKQEYLDEMYSFKKKLISTYNMIEYQSDLASNHYQSQISNLVQCIIKNNDQLILPLKKESQLIPGNTKMKFLRLQYFIFQKKQEEIFKSLKELKALMGDEYISSQSNNNQNYLNRSEIQNGKLLLYTEQCKHTVQNQCNTVPIFSCCKQSYQCVKCHNQHTLHKAVLSTPSQRLCMKCLSVFTVEYSSDILINCNSCLDLKYQQESVTNTLVQSLFIEDVKLNSKQRSQSPTINSQYQTRNRIKSAKDDKILQQSNKKHNQSQNKNDRSSTPDIFSRSQMISNRS